MRTFFDSLKATPVRTRVLSTKRMTIGFGLILLAASVLAANHYVQSIWRERISLEKFYAVGNVPKIFSPAAGPLKVYPANPRYFADSNGRPIVLAGSHTWLNFQDAGHGDPPPSFDYGTYLRFLSSNGHNFFRLWNWEGSRWAVQTSDGDYWFSPQPWKRTGPGNAADSKPKFNLDLFDDTYFQRLRSRCEEAQARGIYVSIMLFDGWAVAKNKAGFDKQNPWKAHPFGNGNNVNDVNGDTSGDASGEETHELNNASVWKYQEAYIRKVVDTVNELGNILYEVSNESHPYSRDWQYQVIRTVKTYEATKPKQHPVGMTSYVGTRVMVTNPDLFNGPADWISPNAGPDREYALDPPPATGEKVVVLDTDHIWGIGGDRIWIWKGFTRGHNFLFMDGYDGLNNYGVGGDAWNRDDRTWIDIRKNLGYILAFASRMNIAAMVPQGHLTSTNYCLATRAGSPKPAFLVYRPSPTGTVQVDLSGATGSLNVEWFNPETGFAIPSGIVQGDAVRSFECPFAGDAVLYLYSSSENSTLSLTK